MECSLSTAREPPRQLLLISYEYPPLGGGLGKSVRRTALEFARLGHTVTILTSRFGGQGDAEKDGPLQVVRVPVLRRHQHHASVLDVLSFAVSGVVLGRRRLGSRRADAILAYLTIPSGVVGGWLSLRLGVPLLTLLRGTDVPGHREVAGWMHALAGPVTRWVWRRSARVVSNSRSMAESGERALPGVRIASVWNGVDVERFVPAREGGAGLKPGRGPRVLYAGRLVRVKRLDLLLRAWAEVRRRLPEGAVLELAGYGPERPNLEALGVQLGLGESLRLLGQLDEDAMIRALQRADVFVSISMDEGLPNAVLEALACGVPVLLSDIGPHREILGEGRGGGLCRADSAESVAEGLLGVLHDIESGKVTPISARETVLGRFDWERTAKELLALLGPGGG